MIELSKIFSGIYAVLHLGAIRRSSGTLIRAFSVHHSAFINGEVFASPITRCPDHRITRS